MSQLRVNFLNWRPDLEPSSHDGLTEAQNVLHDTEGYKPFKLATAGAASTALSVANSLMAVQVRQVGSKLDSTVGNKMHAILERVSGSHAILRVYPPNLTGSDATSMTLTHAAGTVAPMTSLGDITAFEVCELEDYVFVTAEAKGSATGGTELSARITAYMDIDLE